MNKRHLKEINVIHKSKYDTQWRIGLIYPNSYPIGMSGLTVKLLYHLLNQHQNIFTERVFFSPNQQGPPKSIESGMVLNKFDILAFSFQFELDYINAIRIIQQSKIPVYSNDRSNENPLILAGGPTITANPEPLADIVDIIFSGDFESVSDIFLDSIIESKHSSLSDEILSVPGFLSSRDLLLKRNAVFTPKLDEINYPIAQVRPKNSSLKKKGTLDGYFLQISRGCTHGCHFCLIGKIFRPHRERSLPILKHLIKNGGVKTQTNLFSLIGSSTADHSQINDLLAYFNENNLRFILPSIRIDSGTEVLKQIEQSGQKSLTIAPESGSEHTRFKIGKKISDQQIIDFVREAGASKIHQLKLYFIIGMTSDPISEANEIHLLMNKLIQLKTSIKFNVSVNPLVPKRGTRLGKQCVNYSDIEQGISDLKGNLKNKVRYKTFPIHWAIIQAILSIGGREITPNMIDVAMRGGSYLSWRKTFSKDLVRFYQERFCQ